MREPEDIRKLLRKTIAGKRWKHYKHTSDLAEKYRRYVLGTDIDKELRRFVRREDDDLFEQRIELTKNISTSVCSAVKSVFYKVPRSNGMSRRIVYDNDKDGKRLGDLMRVMSTWYAKNDLDSWLPTWFNDLVSIDPNCYIITEIAPFDNTQERAKPYPFIAYSDMVVNKGWNNGVTEWIVVENVEEADFIIGGKLTEKEIHTYTYYDEYQAVIFRQTFDQNIVAMFPSDGVIKEIELADGRHYAIRIGERVFVEYIPEPYNLSELPAYQVGYVTDQLTNGETFVSQLHAGFPYLEKQLKSVSEMDLTQALHAFPQKFIYGKKCNNNQCNKGIMIDTGVTCPDCKGSGIEIHTSSQDSIVIQLPDAPEQMFDLSQLVHYEYPPIDLLKFQQDYIKNLTEEMKRAVFNADTYAKVQVAQTATEQVIDMQSVYDTLYPYAITYANTWKSIVTICAEYTDLKDGLHIEYHVSKDFKLKTTADLIADIKILAESNADEAILQSIQSDIAVNIFADKPRELIKYRVKKQYEVFAGKNENETIYALGQLAKDDKYAVLWRMYGVIWDDLEREQAAKGEDFYLLAPEKRDELLWAKVQQYIDEMPDDGIGEPKYDEGQGNE
jgi:hypothetical protein